jgi:hypothetical protein
MLDGEAGWSHHQMLGITAEGMVLSGVWRELTYGGLAHGFAPSLYIHPAIRWIRNRQPALKPRGAPNL